MTKYIKLNEANGRKCTILLNIDQIGAIQSSNGSDSYVRMSYTYYDKEGKTKNEYYFVTETIDQIEAMINA